MKSLATLTQKVSGNGLLAFCRSLILAETARPGWPGTPPVRPGWPAPRPRRAAIRPHASKKHDLLGKRPLAWGRPFRVLLSPASRHCRTRSGLGTRRAIRSTFDSRIQRRQRARLHAQQHLDRFRAHPAADDLRPALGPAGFAYGLRLSTWVTSPNRRERRARSPAGRNSRGWPAPDSRCNWRRSRPGWSWRGRRS